MPGAPICLVQQEFVSDYSEERKRADRNANKQIQGSTVPVLPVLLPFPELHEHRVYVLKGSVYLFPDLGSGEDDLPRDKDEDHDLGVRHAVDQPREDLRLILSSITESSRLVKRFR